ncbi:ferredoxin [Actinomycetospora cinnamomea]|uniref:Ferredoxin n=1 Tax=Actinomycetospora cinnamomea TaxID=663609 RepID=A0A2U1EC94_9PSEU|nr:ferredoxin [Actinomycetospora cinnamomea]PVY97505.1 ferredoxin [Actinomycetospora cinnamomea]
MRIEADYDRCEGHGQCEERAPAIFELDDDGYLTHHYEGQDLPAELEGAGRGAVAVCPVAALRLAEGT